MRGWERKRDRQIPGQKKKETKIKKERSARNRQWVTNCAKSTSIYLWCAVAAGRSALSKEKTYKEREKEKKDMRTREQATALLMKTIACLLPPMGMSSSSRQTLQRREESLSYKVALRAAQIMYHCKKKLQTHWDIIALHSCSKSSIYCLKENLSTSYLRTTASCSFLKKVWWSFVLSSIACWSSEYISDAVTSPQPFEPWLELAMIRMPSL